MQDMQSIIYKLFYIQLQCRKFKYIINYKNATNLSKVLYFPEPVIIPDFLQFNQILPPDTSQFSSRSCTSYPSSILKIKFRVLNIPGPSELIFQPSSSIIFGLASQLLFPIKEPCMTQLSFLLEPFQRYCVIFLFHTIFSFH